MHRWFSELSADTVVLQPSASNKSGLTKPSLTPAISMQGEAGSIQETHQNLPHPAQDTKPETELGPAEPAPTPTADDSKESQQEWTTACEVRLEFDQKGMKPETTETPPLKHPPSMSINDTNDDTAMMKDIETPDQSEEGKSPPITQEPSISWNSHDELGQTSEQVVMNKNKSSEDGEPDQNDEQQLGAEENLISKSQTI